MGILKTKEDRVKEIVSDIRSGTYVSANKVARFSDRGDSLALEIEEEVNAELKKLGYTTDMRGFREDGTSPFLELLEVTHG